MHLSTWTETAGESTLVAAVIRNDDPGPQRVRVTNRLDGPVWPPRVHGVPAAGWDDGGFEGVVAGDDLLALGYATPAEPADPPAELAWVEPAGESEPETTARSVVRERGDPRPPADVVVPSPFRERGAREDRP